MGLLLDKNNQMCFLVGMINFEFIRIDFFSLRKDYIAGGTLKNLIHDLDIPLTWLQRLRYAKDIAAGMVNNRFVCLLVSNFNFRRSIFILVTSFIVI